MSAISGSSGEGSDIVRLERAVYGRFRGQHHDGYRLQGCSSGFSRPLQLRLEGVCKAWGYSAPQPEIPNFRAYFQLPSTPPILDPQSTMGMGLRPGVFIVCVRSARRDGEGRSVVGFESVFVTEDVYARLDNQPFGLFSSRWFPSEWDLSEELPPLAVPLPEVGARPIPRLDPGDVVTLGQELRHLLSGGSVAYVLPRPDPAATEHLRLLHLGLPIPLRLELGLATFRVALLTSLAQPPTAGKDHFGLSVVHKDGPGREFKPGQANLPVTRRPASSPALVESYVAEYEAALLGGDASRLGHLARKGLPADSAISATPEPRKGFFSRLLG